MKLVIAVQLSIPRRCQVWIAFSSWRFISEG